MKVKGEWQYLYRAIDRDGNLVDNMLSKTRDLVAAKAFFKQAITTVGHKPDRVTTDSTRPIRGPFGVPWAARCCIGPINTATIASSRIIAELTSVITQCVASGALPVLPLFLAFDEARQYFRLRATNPKSLPLAEQRCHFRQRFGDLLACYLQA